MLVTVDVSVDVRWVHYCGDPEVVYVVGMVSGLTGVAAVRKVTGTYVIHSADDDKVKSVCPEVAVKSVEEVTEVSLKEVNIYHPCVPGRGCHS